MGLEDSHIRVPTELGDAGPTVRSKAAALSASLAELQSQIAPLADTWTGDTKIAFDILEDKWHKAAGYFFGDEAGVGILGDIANHLDAAYVNYVNGQTYTTRTWQM